MKTPKFLENTALSSSYYEIPNPYQNTPSTGIELLALFKYARSQNKKLDKLDRKEVSRSRLQK